MGKDTHGKPVIEGLTGELFWPPGLSTRQPAQGSTPDPFYEYAVNRSDSELARMANTDTPEGIAARFAMGALDGDAAATMTRYVIDFMRLPPGAVNVNLTEENREWARQNRLPGAIIYRGELAAVFIPQQEPRNFATFILGKRHGQWKVSLTLDLPATPTLAAAGRQFRERAADLLASFHNFPDEPPSYVEETGKQLATNMTTMMSAMMNTVSQMQQQIATQMNQQLPGIIINGRQISTQSVPSSVH